MDNVEDALQEQMEAREADERQRRAHELLKRIDFKLQVQEFLRGEIGQRLIDDTEHDVKVLKDALADCDCDTEEGRATNRMIRSKLGAIAHWQDAFARYVEEGKAAEVELNEGEQFIQGA